MRRLIFAVGCTVAPVRAAAQEVPGRDLLDFPIGAAAEAPAIARYSADGLWNPASAFLRGGDRLRLSAARVDTPADQGVTFQLVSAAIALPGRLGLGLSVAHGAVTDLVRTATDPQSLGEIPYNTTLISATAARRTMHFLTTGFALRYRTGQLDAVRESTLGVDAGLVADGLFGRDVRVGLATFLWQPGRGGTDQATFSAAGDGRLVGDEERREVRAGYSLAYTPRVGREHYVFASGRMGVIEGRGGIVRAARYGDVDWRSRLGIGLHYARYALGVSRDDGGAGLAPSYQFTLSTGFK